MTEGKSSLPDGVVMVVTTVESQVVRNGTTDGGFETTSVKLSLPAIEAARYAKALREAVRKITSTAAGQGPWFESSITVIPPEAECNGDEGIG